MSAAIANLLIIENNGWTANNSHFIVNSRYDFIVYGRQMDVSFVEMDYNRIGWIGGCQRFFFLAVSPSISVADRTFHHRGNAWT